MGKIKYIIVIAFFVISNIIYSQTWPSSDNFVCSSYGTYEGSGQHNGIDIAGVHGTTAIIAPYDMKITDIRVQNYAHQLQIQAQIYISGIPTNDYIWFGHLDQDLSTAYTFYTGTFPMAIEVPESSYPFISSGTIFATVSDHTAGALSPSFDHVHIAYENGGIPTEVTESVMLNPLEQSFASTNRDPGNTNPFLGPLFIKQPDNLYKYQDASVDEEIYGKIKVTREISDFMGHHEDYPIGSGIYTQNDIESWPLVPINEDRIIGITSTPYTIKFKVLDESNNLVYPYNSSGNPEEKQISFTGNPITNFDYLYDTDKESQANYFNLYYYYCFDLTNITSTSSNNTSTPQEMYWNTRLKSGVAWNGSDAQINIDNEPAFPDGKYKIWTRAEDLSGNYDQEEPEVIVDNFIPFIEKVVIESNGVTVYESDWDINAAGIELTPNLDPNANILSDAYSNMDLTITVFASEPMSTMMISGISPLGVSLSANSSSSDKKEWTFLLPASQIPTDGSADGIHIISIEGTDLAGNSIEAYSESQTSYAFASIPQRNFTAGTSYGNWSPAPNNGADQIHRFKIKSVTVDFLASSNFITPPQAINFTDESTGSIGPWLWEFEGATPSISSDQNPTGIVYNVPGVYDVTLTVSNGVGSNSLTKNGYILVNDPSGAPVVNFNASPKIIEEGEYVDFLDESLNIPTSWQWSFPGGSPSTSTAQHPTGIFYAVEGFYQVSLTAINNTGSDTKTETNYIEVNPYGSGNNPFDASIDCNNFPAILEFNGGQAHVNVAVDIIDGSGLYQYIIDFGNNETFIGNEFYSIPVTKTYTSPGIKTISVSIYTMDNGQYVWVSSCTNNINIYDPCAPMWVTFDTDDELVVNEDIVFTASPTLNPNETSNMITYLWYIDNSTTANANGISPTLTFSSTGPHTVKVDVSGSCATRIGTFTGVIHITPEKCIYLEWTDFPDKITVDGTYNFGGEAFWKLNEDCFPHALNSRITYDNEAIINFAEKRFEYQFDITPSYNDQYVDYSFDFPDSWSGDPVKIVIEAWNSSECECAQKSLPWVNTNFWEWEEDQWGIPTPSLGIKTFVSYNNINGFPLQHPGVYNDNYYTRMVRKIKLGDCNSGTANKKECNHIGNENNAQNVWLPGDNCSSSHAWVSSGNTREVYAHKEITMGRNFTAYSGCDFTAAIDNCGYEFMNEWYKVLSESEYEEEYNNPKVEDNNIEQELFNISASIFPNPHQGTFKIEIIGTDEPATISIINMLSIEILTFELSGNSYQIDLTDYPKGMYIVKTVVGGKTFLEKVVYK